MGAHPFHAVGEEYIRAVVEVTGAVPLLIPALADHLTSAEILDRVDGILLTGSASNVEPHRYDGAPSVPGTLHDPHRDALTLPLIPQAVEAGIPVLGVCRGFQEMNVAYGGTLHQRLHEVTGFLDHRDDHALPLEARYAPAHDVVLEPDGVLRALASGDRIRVNSLHAQGVDRLSDRLVAEARAPDGVIEAFRVKDARQFAVAVQWHPEWLLDRDELSRALFVSLGAACRARAANWRAP